jgi:hypothetical protein
MHILASFGLLLIVLGISGGAWFLWDRSGDAIMPAGRYLGEAGALSIAVAYAMSIIRRRHLLDLRDFIDPRAWSLGLVAIAVSDWICRPWGLFQGPAIRGEIIVGALAMFALLRGWWGTFLLYWPLASAALLLWSFTIASDGHLLFSDDHAMFLFRLKLLKENFPSIPFWSPLWNAGFEARDFFATGALNIFLLGAPLIYLLPVESVYNILIAGILWVLLPASVFSGAALIGVSRLGASVAATLSLCSGLFWYRWSLKYGTLGFIVSGTLLPLVIGLALRFIEYRRPHKRLCLSLALTTSLMLLWSPSGIALLPLGLCALPKLRQMLLSRRHMLTLVLIAAINIPWMTIMWKVSNVGKFLGADKGAQLVTHEATPNAASSLSGDAAAKADPVAGETFRHRSGAIDAKKSLNQWHNNASALNPLLVVFALPALLSLTGLPRVALGLLTTWLMLLGTVGVSVKPQLELDRMVVLASIILTIPVGSFLTQFFRDSAKGILWRVAASISGSFLLLGPFVTSSVVLGRSDEKYRFAGPEVTSLPATLREHAGDGRVVFSGCVLHEFSGGHLGPLPMWSGVPMVASSYAHNIWRYEQPIPKPLLDQGDAGIREYLNLQNATLVLAHEPGWVEYFRSRPSEYQKIRQEGEFAVFSRIGYTSSYTIEGEIRDLITTSSSISLTPNTEHVVLKFKYFPFLKSSACSLEPYPVAGGLVFIRLSRCSLNQPITIKSVSPLQRLLSPSM